MSREMRMEGRKRAQVEEDKTQKMEKDMAWKVDFSGMSLNSLPNPTTELLCITKLDLSNNHLESIPESLIARLLNLEVLDVHSNQLKVLPNSIGCLMKLKVLNVSSNLIVLGAATQKKKQQEKEVEKAKTATHTQKSSFHYSLNKRALRATT